MVVIDTNVLISSVISSKGSPAEIMDLIVKGEIEFCYSKKIFDEYKRKLAKPKFRLGLDEQEAIIRDLEKSGIPIDDPAPSDIEIRDLDDRVFYDAAKENGAILITGDKDLLVLNEEFIMSPADYLKRFK